LAEPVPHAIDVPGQVRCFLLVAQLALNVTFVPLPNERVHVVVAASYLKSVFINMMRAQTCYGLRAVPRARLPSRENTTAAVALERLKQSKRAKLLYKAAVAKFPESDKPLSSFGCYCGEHSTHADWQCLFLVQ
jgi:hypothetical protein